MALTLAVAGTTAAGAYLNAKLHLYKDLRSIVLTKYAERAYAKAIRGRRANCFYLFEDAVRRYGDTEFIWSRVGCYTFDEAYTRVCQYANYFLSIGLQPGKLVAIYLQNSPEFLFVWHGLLAIGCAPALINSNLASDALVHCVGLSGTEILLVDADVGCQERVTGSRDRIEKELGVKLITLSDELKGAIALSSAERPADELRTQVQGKVPCCLIYTSGTTGFSKAVPFPMARAYSVGAVHAYALGQRPGKGGDRWYNCMPLYHGTGGITALCNSMAGVSLAIGKKFSVSGFWRDVRDSKSTALIYVGETARYLLAAPPSPDDKNHNIRLMYGNGMRPDVWPKFQERFGIPEVGEFFNSTEGMFALVMWSRNGFGRGYVGHHGWIWRTMLRNFYVPVKIDPDTGDLWRDPKTGLGKRQPYDEGGELLVKLPDPTAFPGYFRSKKDTDKKILRDVLAKGDIFYRTGDALRRTDDGFWQFMDRLGDTFRWKGENVSTAEVAEVLGGFQGIDEANVYGVTLPNHDGRAGCAALSLSGASAQKVDYQALANHARQKLPHYATPVFLRALKGDVGGLASHNNKQDKVRLRDEGVDPEKRGSRVPGGEKDEILWLPSKESGYVPFRNEDWERLANRQAKL